MRKARNPATAAAHSSIRGLRTGWRCNDGCNVAASVPPFVCERQKSF